MIKTLGQLEIPSDLASIAPVLQQWAGVVTNQDTPVRAAGFVLWYRAWLSLLCLLGPQCLGAYIWLWTRHCCVYVSWLVPCINDRAVHPMETQNL